MELLWDDVRLFLAVAESKSLRRAAQVLRVGQPTVTRRLAAFEERLGVRLFARGASGAQLTSAGARLLEPARRMSEWAGELARSSRRTAAPVGTVRITAPPGVAYHFLVPFAAWMREPLPHVRLEVRAAVQYLDLARGEADLALRIKAPSGPELVSLASASLAAAAFAAPSYRKRFKRGVQPADLDWIAWAPPLEHLEPNPTLEALIPGFQPVFAADDFLVQCRAAQVGLGAILFARYHGRFGAPSGLEELPILFGPKARLTLHLVCARRVMDEPRVRAVAELLGRELQAAAEAR